MMTDAEILTHAFALDAGQNPCNHKCGTHGHASDCAFSKWHDREVTSPGGKWYPLDQRFVEAPLSFPGGDAIIRKPTRAELVLSATQWTTRIREELHDYENSAVLVCVPAGVHAAIRRLEAIHEELKVTP